MSFFTHSDAKMAVESVNLLRSKYGKDKKIYYERQLYEKPKQKDYLLAQYLESMRTPRSRKSNKSRYVAAEFILKKRKSQDYLIVRQSESRLSPTHTKTRKRQPNNLRP